MQIECACLVACGCHHSVMHHCPDTETSMAEDLGVTLPCFKPETKSENCQDNSYRCAKSPLSCAGVWTLGSDSTSRCSCLKTKSRSLHQWAEVTSVSCREQQMRDTGIQTAISPSASDFLSGFGYISSLFPHPHKT